MVGPSQLAVSSNGGSSSPEFFEILGCCRGVWWGFSSDLAETKDCLSANNAKNEGGRAKNEA